jgi:hypothetical protein
MDQWVVDPVVSFLNGMGWDSEGCRGVEMPDILFQEPGGKQAGLKGKKRKKVWRK